MSSNKVILSPGTCISKQWPSPQKLHVGPYKLVVPIISCQVNLSACSLCKCLGKMDKESETVIREWLAEYKSLPETTIPNYADSVMDRDDVLDALMKLFEHIGVNDEQNLVQPVCHQVFEFYRSRFSKLKTFTMNLLPSIILHHIIMSNNDSTSTDTLLLSIYALASSGNSSDEAGIEIPQLGYPSIYHDPMSGIFSDQMLNIQTPGRKFFQKPTSPNYHVVFPSNRFQILTQVLSVYFGNISLMKNKSHLSLCRSCKFLASSGFSWKSKYLGNGSKDHNCRYPLSVQFMLRMLRCAHFTMYNKCLSESHEAIEAMNRRARKEMIPQVIFLCNAILNSATGQNKCPDVGEKPPFGLTSVNLTPIPTRETSRKGGRWAATAKSIKVHKWRHCNEEISGDLSRSLQNQEPHNHPPRIGQNSETDDATKADKYSAASPSKLLKSKLKKSATSGSPGIAGLTDKVKSPAPSTGEKKSKKSLVDKSAEDQEKVKRSPTQRKDGAPKSLSAATSLQKHQSFDETYSATKQKSVSVSKSSSDVGKSAVTGKIASLPGREDGGMSTTSFLGDFKPDVTNCSAESDERTKETFPLLPMPGSPSRAKNSSTQLTAF